MDNQTLPSAQNEPAVVKFDGPSEPNISVNAAMFRACAECQSKEETRYYLNGVYVQPHPEVGAVMVATDGHRMMVAYDKDGQCKSPAIVALPTVAYAPLTKSADARIEVDTNGIASCGHYRSEKSTITDGVYPDWAKVIKPVVELAKRRFYGKPVFDAAHFNPTYLGSFAKAAKHLGLGNATPVRVVAFGEHDPALILFAKKPEVFALLMPMRGGIDAAVPTFMRAILGPKKKPAAKAKKSPAKRKAA